MRQIECKGLRKTNKLLKCEVGEKRGSIIFFYLGEDLKQYGLGDIFFSISFFHLDVLAIPYNLGKLF